MMFLEMLTQMFVWLGEHPALAAAFTLVAVGILASVIVNWNRIYPPDERGDR